MEIILKKNVDKLGYEGEIVSVKAGYGRNFLIPQGYAVLATVSAKKSHAEDMKQKSHKENQIKGEAEAIAAQLEGLTVKVKAKVGENDKIFGSITTIALSEALKADGINIDRKSLKIKAEPIKDLGTHEASANLHKEVLIDFNFEVVAE
jgi:large subunit ribosomal protein L9